MGKHRSASFPVDGRGIDEGDRTGSFSPRSKASWLFQEKFPLSSLLVKLLPSVQPPSVSIDSGGSEITGGQPGHEDPVPALVLGLLTGSSQSLLLSRVLGNSRLLPLQRLSWMTKPRALASRSALLLNLVFFYYARSSQTPSMMAFSTVNQKEKKLRFRNCKIVPKLIQGTDADPASFFLSNPDF